MTINELVSDELMSLDAAIIHADERAASSSCACAAQHAQLASWLRELQQYRAAAEPVAWVMKDDLADTDIISTPAYLSFSDAVTKTVGKLIPLYAAPQVTSVPDVGTAHSSIIAEQLAHVLSGMDVTDHQRAIINCAVDRLNKNAEEIQQKTAAPAVQAEQLSGNTEQVSQPYTLPSDVRNALVLALQAMEFMGDTLNNLDAVCTEDVEHVTPAFEAVRAVLAGNSPAIPDCWIPASERMPEPKSERRVCVYTPTPHEDMRYRFVPASLFKRVCSSATHWYYMEPPAAPKQDFREIPNSSTNNCRENAETSTKCWCHTCRPVTMTDMRFVVCPECGNKRCPHANDHRNVCTGSNEPGQESSAYPAAPQQEAE